MSEHIAAEIRVGGKITRAQAEELVALARNYNLTVDYCGEEPSLDNIGTTWGDGEVNYGNLDDIITYCCEHDIAYESWFDAGSEWSAQHERFIDGEKDSFVCPGNEGPMIALEELIKTDALASGWAALHERIRKWAKPLPLAEIVDEQETLSCSET
jgi:hypothetical protein